MAQIIGTNVLAPVVPFDTNDETPSHDAEYGKGGFRSVATADAMRAIPLARRTHGMMVLCIDTMAMFVLAADLQTWSEDLTNIALPSGTEGTVLRHNGMQWASYSEQNLVDGGNF